MTAPPEIKQLADLIRGNFGKTWKYINYTSKFLTAPGENYGSVILQVDVIYEENNKQNKLYLVSKLCPPSEMLKEAFLSHITFKKEIKAYTEFCPAIEKFQMNLPQAKRLDFFAKCYGARMNLSNKETIDDDAAIVLENLKIQGYAVEDRLHGFDLPTTHLILKNLAKLHASTIAIRLLNPKEFEEKLLPSMEQVNIAGVMVDGFVDVAINWSKTIEECKPYWEKVTNILNEHKKIGGLLFPFKTNPDFYSVVHTDLWTNNIMILRDQNKNPLKARMVDLQLLDYGSGIRDVLFLLFSSVEIETCDKYFDDFLKFYHNIFIDCLTDFKCDISKFSWDKFMKEINDIAPLELFHIMFMIKPLFSERGSIESMESLDVKDFGRTDNIGEIYLKKLKQIILTFANRKWI